MAEGSSGSHLDSGLELVVLHLARVVGVDDAEHRGDGLRIDGPHAAKIDRAQVASRACNINLHLTVQSEMLT